MTSSWMPCNAGILMTASTYVTRPRQMEDIAFASPGQRERVCCSSSYPMAPILYYWINRRMTDCLMLSMSVIPAIMSNKKRRQLIIVALCPYSG
ncbi:hypothetical protein ECZU20_54370 [Escherichia coli]|nr:hypothetical protein ECZU20_54370 [Escherichia coli]